MDNQEVKEVKEVKVKIAKEVPKHRVKGSQEARDFMKALREKRKPKVPKKEVKEMDE